ncbi:unnamed protein product [Boreogadus saida]
MVSGSTLRKDTSGTPLPAAEAVVPRQRAAGLRRETIPFSSTSRFSLLQIDVEVEEPETSENKRQTPQSFEAHKAFGRVL